MFIDWTTSQKNAKNMYNTNSVSSYSNESWYLAAFGEKIEGKTSSYSSNNGDLLTTGASKQTEVYHIFDVAGNLYEWTDESSLYKAKTANETNVQYRIARGGGYFYSSDTRPVCIRSSDAVDSYTSLTFGFRVTLYIK